MSAPARAQCTCLVEVEACSPMDTLYEPEKQMQLPSAEEMPPPPDDSAMQPR